jgi:hypothetical protein
MKRLAAGIALVLILAMCGSTAYAQVLKSPYLIYPNNNTEMQVLWQDSSAQTDTISWGLSTSNLGQNPVQVGEWSPPSAQTSASGYVGHQHLYTITGLTPNTKYYYQVVDAKTGKPYPGSFITAPAANATSVKFLAMGDSRTNPWFTDSAMTMMRTFYQQPGNAEYQRLAIHNGDWVSTDGESYWTNEWFSPTYTDIRTFTANTPLMGCKGNHEDDGGYSAYFSKYLPFPYPDLSLYPSPTSPSYQSGNPNYYNYFWSFDYGPVHFTIIDEYSDMSAGSVQYNWVKGDLMGTTKPWKIVIYHEPSYAAGTSHTGNTAVQVFEGRGGTPDIFTENKVDLIYSGHNHSFARTGVYNSNQAAGDPISPNVPHITSGGGGAPLNPVDVSNTVPGLQHTITAWEALEFMAFNIQGNTLQATAYQVNNAKTNAAPAGLTISPIETLTLHHFSENVTAQAQPSISCPNGSTNCTLTLKNTSGTALTGTLNVVLDGMFYLQGVGNANSQYGGSNTGSKVATNAACEVTASGTVCPYALVTNVTLVNASGSHNGEPLIQVSTTGLAAGKSVSVPLQFSAPINLSKINPLVFQQ